MSPMIYLDNATAAKPSEASISAMMPFLTKYWGTPVAPHQKGQELFSSLEEAYRSIYHLLRGSEKGTFIFTSSGTESVNHVINAVYNDISVPTGKNHFVAPAIENAPIIMTIENLERQGGIGKTIQVNGEGLVTIDTLADAITPRTALVSMSWVNGLTGVLQPVAEISDVCKERGILLHLDVTHALGKIYFEFEDLGADILTFNGSQIHAPQGTGGIYLREGLQLSPFIVGGLEQAGCRAGNMNVAALVGLGAAAKEASEAQDYLCTEVARLRHKLEKGILAGCPGATVLFENLERVPHISTIAFNGITSELLSYTMNRKGLCLNIGGGEYQQIAYLLKTMGISENNANCAVSFALSRETTDEEIDKAIEMITQAVEKLSKVSEELLCR